MDTGVGTWRVVREPLSEPHDASDTLSRPLPVTSDAPVSASASQRSDKMLSRGTGTSAMRTTARWSGSVDWESRKGAVTGGFPLEAQD